MINLNDCVKEQKLRLHGGKIVSYVTREPSRSYPHEVITEDGDCLSYTDEGIHHTSGYRSDLNVVEILPLGTTDSPKHDKHPSIAWWESCPWITDREPTEEDGDKFGRVFVKMTEARAVAILFSSVHDNEAWIHHHDWKPPVLTDKEQALQLLGDHRDGWTPTPEQWHVIRKGLEAS